MREAESSITVGWAGYGEFVVRPGFSPEVGVVRDAVDELEAAICFCQSVLPLALPLLGLEPLHASAVSTSSGALLLVGPSGSGKTTLATSLVGRRYPLLADDASAFDDEGRLWPGPPLMNLRPDSLTAPVAGQIVGRYNRKLAVRPARWLGEPSQCAAVVLLEPAAGAHLDVTLLSARAALPAILGQVRAPRVLADRRRSAQLRLAARLSSDVLVATLSYDPARHSAGDTADAVLGALGCRSPDSPSAVSGPVSI